MPRSRLPSPWDFNRSQGELFDSAPALPEGLSYLPDFLSAEQETALLAVFTGLPLQPARYKGYAARRQVLSYGTHYDFDDQRLLSGQPLPEALLPLREQVAAWRGMPPEAFVNVLVAEYAPGTPLGWHRDVPDFEMVVGVSLASACEMRFRRYPPEPPGRRRTGSLTLARRSAYVLQGEARWRWQHCVPPTPGLRYSVTLRTRVINRWPHCS